MRRPRTWPINRCPHIRTRGVYGDEINFVGGYRLICVDCGRRLDGPVWLATDGESFDD